MSIPLAEKKFYGSQLTRILLLAAIILGTAAFIYYTVHHVHQALDTSKDRKFFGIACTVSIIIVSFLIYKIITNDPILEVEADGLRITGPSSFGSEFVNWVDVEKFELCSYQNQDLILIFTKKPEVYMTKDNVKRDAQLKLLRDSGAPLAINVGRINKEEEEVLEFLEQYHAEWKAGRQQKKGHSNSSL